jgi:hypothetical protein
VAVALSDLVVSQAELTESQIEELIEPYVRYDAMAKRLVLLPPASNLSNRQRVIAYLVALSGWPFVLSDDLPPIALTPAELGSALNIPGGTLRPILKTLKDERLIQVNEGRYSVNHVTFPFLKKQLSGETDPRPKTVSKAKGRSRPPTQVKVQETKDEGPDTKALTPEPKPPEGAAQDKPKRRTRRDATAAGTGPLSRVRELIAEGWFSEPRPVRDIVEELASRGATYRGQDLTRQMLILTRSRELTRNKKAVGGSGKQIWHYSSPST